MRSHTHIKRYTVALLLLALSATHAPRSAFAIASSQGYLLPSAIAFDGQAGLPSSSARTVTLPSRS